MLRASATDEAEAAEYANVALSNKVGQLESYAEDDSVLESASAKDSRILDQVTANIERVGKDQQTTDDVLDPDYPEPLEVPLQTNFMHRTRPSKPTLQCRETKPHGLSSADDRRRGSGRL